MCSRTTITKPGLYAQTFCVFWWTLLTGCSSLNQTVQCASSIITSHILCKFIQVVPIWQMTLSMYVSPLNVSPSVFFFLVKSVWCIFFPNSRAKCLPVDDHGNIRWVYSTDAMGLLQVRVFYFFILGASYFSAIDINVCFITLCMCLSFQRFAPSECWAPAESCVLSRVPPYCCPLLHQSDAAFPRRTQT